MKTDDYLYDGISPEYKQMQKDLATHKISQAHKLKAKICAVLPKDRDIDRYVAVTDAIKFWEKSKEW